MSDELPEGWSCSPLRGLVRHTLGGDWGKGEEDREPESVPVAVVRSTEFRQWQGARASGAARRFIRQSSLSKRKLLVDDLVVEVSGGGPNQPVGRVLRVDASALVSSSLPLVCSNFCRQLRLDPNISASFIEHALAWIYSTGQLEPIQTQTTNLRNLNFESFLDLELPMPPLAEQRRIVAKVEALLEQVRRAKDRLDRVPLILKRFRQAVLAAALSGKLTEGWRQVHPDAESVDTRRQRLGATNEMSRRRRGRGTTGLSECDPPDDLPESWLVDSVRGLVERGVILDFQDGNHGSLYPRSSEFGDTGTKFITAKQVFDGRVLYADAPLLANDRAAQLRIGFARPGDVLLTHNATVGRVAVLPEDAGNCMLGTSVTYYRLRPELMLPTFCMHFMQSRLWQQQLEKVMEQTTRNQVSVRKQAELWMVAPPPDEQVEIARRVEALLACAGSIQHRVERAAARAGSLPQAILSKAFAGELVPTEAERARAEGRDYETAEQLLELVRREQSDSAASQAAPQWKQPRRARK